MTMSKLVIFGKHTSKSLVKLNVRFCSCRGNVNTHPEQAQIERGRFKIVIRKFHYNSFSVFNFLYNGY